MSQAELVERLIESGVLLNQSIIDAFYAVDRVDFVPEEYKNETYEDRPAPIGHGATTSQPTTIAFMLEKLKTQTGERVLEIGAGSGYVTALLAFLVGKAGEVYSIEYVPELKEFAEENLKKYQQVAQRIFLRVGDGKEGWPEHAPYQRIISGASADEVPGAWQEQLAVGGRIVTPFRDGIAVWNKETEGTFRKEFIAGFSFVQLQ